MQRPEDDPSATESASLAPFEINGTVRGAAKWSLLTELLSRVIAPITQLILARILAPEAFGVLATVLMVASFAQTFSDAGFQKFLIQHSFADTTMLYRSANVAFWASLAVATAMIGGLIIFRDTVAAVVGNPGLGVPIAVTSLSLPLAVLSGTQEALFHRAFAYRKLLPIRIGVAAVPLGSAVPLSLAGFGYWSLIIGVLCAATASAFALTRASPWKPSLSFSFSLLRDMFTFSFWSLLESLSIWATLWTGTFVVGSLLSAHELGLYREPIVVVNAGFALITNATTPILFTALSRLQLQPEAHRTFFLQFQFVASVVLLPVGVVTFFYREAITYAFFGPQWGDAALMLGTWALSSSFITVFSHFSSEIFRSLGRPRISLLAQCVYMAVMIPAIYVAAHDGFTTLVIVSACIRIVSILINQALTFAVIRIGLLRTLKNVCAPLISTSLVGIVSWWFASIAAGRFGWSVLGLVGCAAFYVLVCLCFPRTRRLICNTLDRVRSRRGAALRS